MNTNWKEVKHFEGDYIPYTKKERLGILNKMSNYTACGLLFNLDLKITLTEKPSKVTCPDCLKEMAEQKRIDDIKYNKTYIPKDLVD